ncbi:copia protein [Tanacetum coccineum]
MKVEESLNVTFDVSPPPTKLSPLVDDDVGEEEAIKNNTKVVNNNNEEDESIEVDEVVNIKDSKNYLLDQYSMGMVDNTLFTKKSKSHLIIVQIYVDDIIFGSTSQNLCDDFAKIMHDEFEMSMMGELNFFLGLQIKQMEDEIFFNQSKYIKEMLKKFGLEDSKPTKTPMSTEIKLYKDDEADFVDSSKYRVDRFTFYERVMDPLDISRNPTKEKGKRVTSPSVTSSSSSSSDDNEAPSFLKFYEELSDNEDLTNAQ